MSKPYHQNPTLTEKEVRRRLERCGGRPDVVSEIYDFGKLLMKESIDRVQRVESKATSLAAYGTAVITLLVSSSSLWSPLGGPRVLWIAFGAAMFGLVCVFFSLQSILLREYEYISQDEWLQSDCLSSTVDNLKLYRVLTIWGVITQKDKIQKEKADFARHAQIWLAGSALCLCFLLLNLALVRSFGLWGRIASSIGIASWKIRGGDDAFFFGASAILCGFVWYSRLRFIDLLRGLFGFHGTILPD